MLDHAFGTLGLHRIALFVFEFNERAMRAYRRCGFVVEGRARESIWRDGRWWDELAMSVLQTRLAPQREDETAEEREEGGHACRGDRGGRRRRHRRAGRGRAVPSARGDVGSRLSRAHRSR